jgi:hypothetical protein
MSVCDNQPLLAYISANVSVCVKTASGRRGAGYQPAACYQQACFSVSKSRLVGGCGPMARPTLLEAGNGHPRLEYTVS